MNGIAVEINGLTYEYDKTSCVLKNVTFNIPEGSIITILGKNGVGKTTLLNCLLGFYNDYTGVIRLFGKEQRQYTRKELSKVIGLVPQLSQVSFDYTVEEFVLMGGNSSLNYFSLPDKKTADIMEKSLENLGISHLKDRSINSLSGGERQLAYIARALTQHPKIIVLDEPTSALDFGNSMRITELINKLKNEGYTVILTCHNPDYPFIFHDYTVAMMSNNEVVFGKSEEILTDELLSRLYEIKIRRHYISECNQYVCIKA